MSKELRPYQVEAIDAITAALKDGGRGQLHAACGSGKTLMAMRAAEAVVPSDGLVVVLAPSLGLVAQILENWADASVIPFQRFAVCSNDGVALADDQSVGFDDMRVPTSTNPTDIAKWIRAGGPRLVVGTYLSAGRLAEAVRSIGAEVDILVCDEAHHLAGDSQGPTRRVLDDAVLPARRRLYITATPRLTAKRNAATALTMDDHATFGPVLYTYAFSRAIAEMYLSDYRIAVIGVMDQEARALLGRDDLEYAEGLGMRAAAAQVALARAYKEYGLRRAITFHATVEEARSFTETLPQTLAALPADDRVPEPTCLHANGTMSGAERRQVLKDLADPPIGGWAVASNARCLSEGVDVPAVDGILFTHAKESVVDVVQAAGRALRLHPDAPGLSTVIVPVILSSPDALEDEIESGAFETLISIVRALRGHDDLLASELGSAGAEVRRPEREGLSHSPKLTALLPPGVASDLLRRVRLVTAQRREDRATWWEMLEAFRVFKAEAKRVPVSQYNKKLSSWLAAQRKAANAGTLPEDKRHALDEAGIDWGTKGYGEQCSVADAAEVFHAEHGHLFAPQLGSRLKGMRDLRERGSLDSRIESRLNKLGMVWDGVESARLERLQAARIFRAAFGDLVVPVGYVESKTGIHLGDWLDGLRAEDCTFRRYDRYGGGRDQVDARTVKTLDELGMVWDAYHHANYATLQAWFWEWEHASGHRALLPQELRIVKASVALLVTHLEAAHGIEAVNWRWGYSGTEAAKAAAASHSVDLACNIKACRFVTTSGTAGCWSDSRSQCPACSPTVGNQEAEKVLVPVSTWHLGDALHHLYRCTKCGHRWAESRSLKAAAATLSSGGGR